MYSFHKYWNATDEASIAAYVAYRARWNVPLWLGETGENNNAWYSATLDLVRRKEIGWCFWPWKKIWTDNCPAERRAAGGELGADQRVLRGQAAARPSPEVAAAAVRAMLQAARPALCKRNTS